MCNFFSFVTEPEYRGGERFYFNWQQRKKDLDGEWDSHSTICKHYKLNEDICNKYEFNPLTKEFGVDDINAPVDDRVQAEEWANKLDFKKIVKPLIIKPIIHPFNDVPGVEQVTEEHIKWLKEYIKVRASVRASVWDSVWDSVGVYASSFFDIKYGYDFSCGVKLWGAGLVPSFDGTTWRLHTGKNAKVVYEVKG